MGMDDYPDDLSPEFDEGGGVTTPFDVWWERVKTAFPHVPEEVARDWLHRHWRYSPFGFLKSAVYRFRKVAWPASNLKEIRINWNDFADDDAPTIDQGRYLAEEHKSRWGFAIADYMIEHGVFPVPPIIIDNRDHHVADRGGADYYPAAYLLVEGHRRFHVASYLASQGRTADTLEFWLMERAQDS